MSWASYNRCLCILPGLQQQKPRTAMFWHVTTSSHYQPTLWCPRPRRVADSPVLSRKGQGRAASWMSWGCVKHLQPFTPSPIENLTSSKTLRLSMTSWGWVLPRCFGARVLLQDSSKAKVLHTSRPGTLIWSVKVTSGDLTLKDLGRAFPSLHGFPQSGPPRKIVVHPCSPTPTLN